MKLQCRCVWAGERCPLPATQEDGLCDWCGVRRDEQLRSNPNVLLDLEGNVLGLGGVGQHGQTAELIEASIAAGTSSACWMPNSGRTLEPWPAAS